MGSRLHCVKCLSQSSSLGPEKELAVTADQCGQEAAWLAVPGRQVEVIVGRVAVLVVNVVGCSWQAGLCLKIRIWAET